MGWHPQHVTGEACDKAYRFDENTVVPAHAKDGRRHMYVGLGGRETRFDTGFGRLEAAGVTFS